MASSGRRENVGIFGGTFDPVHHGHLIAASRVQALLGLSKVFLVPCSSPPHKPCGPAASAEARLEMLRLATRGNPTLDVLDVEIARGGISYTIDTLRYLNKQHPELKFTTIIGSDAFAEITTWKEYERLFDEGSFAVMTRCGFSLQRCVSLLPQWLSEEVERAPCFGGESGGRGEVSEGSTTANLLVVEAPQIEISGSLIRRIVRAGESIQYFVPEDVRNYIIRRGLYRSE